MKNINVKVKKKNQWGLMKSCIGIGLCALAMLTATFAFEMTCKAEEAEIIKIDAPGSFIWNECTGMLEFTRPENGIGYYVASIYKLTEEGEELIGEDSFSLGTSASKGTFKRGIKPEILEKMDEGCYYATLIASHGTDNAYEDSEPVKSSDFNYVLPNEKLEIPSNLSWEGNKAVWDYEASAACLLQLYYSESESGEYEYVFGAGYSRNPDRNKVITSATYFNNFTVNEGYYKYRIRMLSNNIVDIMDSDWSDYSPVLSYTDLIDSEASLLADKMDSGADSNELKDALFAMKRNYLLVGLRTSESLTSLYGQIDERFSKDNGIKVSVNTADSVKEALEGDLEVSGISFNRLGEISDMSVTFDEPSLLREYDPELFETVTQIGIRGQGFDNTENLMMPIRISMPLPKDVSSKNLQLLICYEGRNAYEFVKYELNGNNISFSLDRLGDLVFANYAKNAITYKDVVSTDWWYEAVRFVDKNNIVSGDGSKDKFSPKADCTREMLSQMLYNYAKAFDAELLNKDAEDSSGALEGEEGKLENESVEAVNKYKDIVEGKWYFDAVNWILDKKIASGKSSLIYGIGTNVNREEVAVYLYNYAKLKGMNTEASFNVDELSDASEISTWAREAIAFAITKEIMNPKEDGSISPKNTASRAEVSKMLMTFNGIEEE